MERRKPKAESLPSEPSPAQSRRGPARANIRAMANAHAAVKERDADRAVRDQLQRIVASATFQQVDRLKRFLTFVVDETIAEEVCSILQSVCRSNAGGHRVRRRQ